MATALALVAGVALVTAYLVDQGGETFPSAGHPHDRGHVRVEQGRGVTPAPPGTGPRLPTEVQYEDTVQLLLSALRG